MKTTQQALSVTQRALSVTHELVASRRNRTCQPVNGTSSGVCATWPTMKLRALDVEYVPWPQSCPTTKSAQPMNPTCARPSTRPFRKPAPGEGGFLNPRRAGGRWCVSGWSIRRRGVVRPALWSTRLLCGSIFQTHSHVVGLSVSPSLGSQLSPYRHGIRRRQVA